MKINQTFWSCNNKDLINFNAGWLSPEYNLMSWALSCLRLKEYYREVELYTDSFGAKVLIDILNIPYSEVICNLDNFNYYNNVGLWALPKIKTYSLQEQPFLHVDGDVFIWKSFDCNLLNSDLITQNEEAATNYYENILTNLEKELLFFPDEILFERKSNKPIHAFNAGIFGGIDVEFIQQYSYKAIEFVEKNQQVLNKINTSNFNIFFEQYLFYCLCKKENKKVTVLIDEVIGDNQYKDFGNFNEVPYNKTYLHLLGNYKRNSIVCNSMAFQLRKEYPSYYYKIIEIFKQKKFPLYRDYYYSKTKFQLDEFSKSHKSFENDFSTQYNSYFKEAFFNSIVDLINNNTTEKLDFSIHFEDYCNLNSTIENLVVDKFSRYSREFLYNRDLESANYFSFLFSNHELTKDRELTFDNIIEIVESKFDWSSISLQEENIQSKLLEQLISDPSKIYTAVIPECHQNHCNLINIDELDLALIEQLKTPVSFRILLASMENFFEKEDLEESRFEFEKLIIGRLKYGLQHKMYKTIMS
jgi:hypothetical protein